MSSFSKIFLAQLLKIGLAGSAFPLYLNSATLPILGRLNLPEDQGTEELLLLVFFVSGFLLALGAAYIFEYRGSLTVSSFINEFLVIVGGLGIFWPVFFFGHLLVFGLDQPEPTGNALLDLAKNHFSLVAGLLLSAWVMSLIKQSVAGKGNTSATTRLLP